jgi:hypothetical protein
VHNENRRAGHAPFRGGRSPPPPDRGWREGAQACLASDGVISHAAMLSRCRAAAVPSPPALSQGTEAHHMTPPCHSVRAAPFHSAERRHAAPYPRPVVSLRTALRADPRDRGKSTNGGASNAHFIWLNTMCSPLLTTQSPRVGDDADEHRRPAWLPAEGSRDPILQSLCPP